MPTPLSNEERETMFNIVADDRSLVHVYSDDPFYIRRMEKIGATLVREDGTARWYTLPANQLSFRNPAKPRVVSDERKKASAERLRQMRKKQASERTKDAEA